MTEERQRKRLGRILDRWEADEAWLRRAFGTYDENSIAPEADIQRNHSTALQFGYHLLSRAPGYFAVHKGLSP